MTEATVPGDRPADEPVDRPVTTEIHRLSLALLAFELDDPHAAELAVRGMKPEVLTRLAAHADRASQLCLALAQRGPVPDGVSPAETAAFLAEHPAPTPGVHVPPVSLSFDDALFDDEDPED